MRFTAESVHCRIGPVYRPMFAGEVVMPSCLILNCQYGEFIIFRNYLIVPTKYHAIHCGIVPVYRCSFVDVAYSSCLILN